MIPVPTGGPRTPRTPGTSLKPGLRSDPAAAPTRRGEAPRTRRERNSDWIRVLRPVLMGRILGLIRGSRNWLLPRGMLGIQAHRIVGGRGGLCRETTRRGGTGRESDSECAAGSKGMKQPPRRTEGAKAQDRPGKKQAREAERRGDCGEQEGKANGGITAQREGGIGERISSGGGGVEAAEADREDGNKEGQAEE
ncbi:unnamed protein product [Natator depressus]